MQDEAVKDELAPEETFLALPVPQDRRRHRRGRRTGHLHRRLRR